MDTNEIMATEEAIEMTEEIVRNGSGKGFKMAAGIGLAVLAGGVAYKYIVSPVMAKIKARKNQEEIDKKAIGFEDDEIEGFEENE